MGGRAGRTTVKEVKIFLDEETLGIILCVPVKVIQSIEGCKPSNEFTKHATKRRDIKRAAILHPCRKDQRAALLKFKKPLTLDPSLVTCSSYSYTSSWNRSRDCCLWDGVICDEMTGHVIELNLSCSGLVGKIDSNNSLFQLSRLQRLDLLLITSLILTSCLNLEGSRA
ncbi:hypothetical protein H5410_027177 [Solanum commersonii]|uniref:Leucine-rich repeat-containing N-terminal plant-type domain-containing protein n=1 Tax=Solanum commersonii TaxID=4109 RepID=A0A9J5Z0K6_SOLCO|nr:hypothetical protein H5410_027177 [Solanum commersonii]